MFPVLLSRPGLSTAQRWRLADSLFAQTRPLVEGSAALLALLLLCWWRTGLPLFAGIGLGTALLFVARLRLMSRYWAERGQGSPDAWAARFLPGAICTGAVWGLTSFAVFRGVADPPLRTVVVMVQAGWVAGVAVRNAASPAAALLQSAAASLPAAAAFVLSRESFFPLAALFFPLQLSANAAIARFLGQQTLSLLASEQALADANARLAGSCTALSEANRQLEHLSATDGLTGIGNRRAFDAVLHREWARAARDGSALSLLVLDVDLFKSFNDHYGHPAGDDCLRRIAATLESGLRHPPDFAARFGGEEFVALLPGIDAAGAAKVGERLRHGVIGAAIMHAQCPGGLVTISIGAATLHPAGGALPQALIDAADHALYRAKELGRNRVESAAAEHAQAA